MERIERSEREVKRKRPWYSWIFLLLVIVAVMWYVWRNIDEIIRYNYHFNWLFLVGSFLAVVASYVVMLAVWIGLTSSMGLRAPLLATGKSFYLSQLGKYVPGNLGLFLVRLDVYRSYSRRKVAVSTGIEYLVASTAMCIVILVGLASAPVRLPDYIRLVAAAGIVALLLLLWPPFLKKCVDRGFKFMKREPIDELPPYGLTLRLVGAQISVALLFGLGFYLLLCSFEPIRFSNYLFITGAFYASALVGIITFFSPGGIGVREGLLFLILPSFIPRPTVIVGAVAARLIQVAVEILLVAVFVVAEKYFAKKSSCVCYE